MKTWEDYLYPNGVLKNKKGIQDFEEFISFEYEKTGLRFNEIKNKPLIKKLDFQGLKQIHKYLFNEIYDWAGEIREVDIRKDADSPFFVTPKSINKTAEQMFYALQRSNYFTNSKTKEQFLNQASDFLDKLNYLHPFREGNGRTQKVFMNYIAGVNGYTFDYSLVTKEEWNRAFTSMNMGFTNRIQDVLSKAIKDIPIKEINKYREAFRLPLLPERSNIMANDEKAYQQNARPRNNKEFTEKLLKDFIASLDDPIEKWTESWKMVGGRPINAISHRPYTGLNQLQLFLWMYKNKVNDPRFATFDQIHKNGWYIKKGESAHVVLRVGFMKVYDYKEDKEIVDAIVNSPKYEKDERYEIIDKFLGYRLYPLFHASQIDGISKFKEFKNDKIQMNDFVIESLYALNIPLKQENRATCPYYDSQKDEVHIPPKTSFLTDEGLAVDIIHELSHATGHPNRLNRSSLRDYGSSKEIRAKEELIAEISTVLTRTAAGLGVYGKEELKNHKAYCQGWKQALSSENGVKILEEVANEATKASNYLVDHVRDRIRDINSLEGYLLVNKDKYEAKNKYEFFEKQQGPYCDFTDDILKAKVFETEFLASKELSNISAYASPDFPNLDIVHKTAENIREKKKTNALEDLKDLMNDRSVGR